MDERNSCDLSLKKYAFHKCCIHSAVKVLILVYELMHQTKENLLHKFAECSEAGNTHVWLKKLHMLFRFFAMYWTQSQCPLYV